MVLPPAPSGRSQCMLGSACTESTEVYNSSVSVKNTGDEHCSHVTTQYPSDFQTRKKEGCALLSWLACSSLGMHFNKLRYFLLTEL